MADRGSISGYYKCIRDAAAYNSREIEESEICELDQGVEKKVGEIFSMPMFDTR